MELRSFLSHFTTKYGWLRNNSIFDWKMGHFYKKDVWLPQIRFFTMIQFYQCKKTKFQRKTAFFNEKIDCSVFYRLFSIKWQISKNGHGQSRQHAWRETSSCWYDDADDRLQQAVSGREARPPLRRCVLLPSRLRLAQPPLLEEWWLLEHPLWSSGSCLEKMFTNQSLTSRCLFDTQKRPKPSSDGAGCWRTSTLAASSSPWTKLNGFGMVFCRSLTKEPVLW